MEEAVFDPTPSTEVQGEATGDDDVNGLDDDKYIMIQCLFVTFLFIPALLPSPLPRPELLCLDKT